MPADFARGSLNKLYVSGHMTCDNGVNVLSSFSADAISTEDDLFQFGVNVNDTQTSDGDDIAIKVKLFLRESEPLPFFPGVNKTSVFVSTNAGI